MEPAQRQGLQTKLERHREALQAIPGVIAVRVNEEPDRPDELFGRFLVHVEAARYLKSVFAQATAVLGEPVIVENLGIRDELEDDSHDLGIG